MLTGFVGLASMAAAVSLPLCIAWTGLAWDRPFLTFGLFAAVLIVLTHRANIARMCTGREPRARRLWLLGRRAASRPGGGRSRRGSTRSSRRRDSTPEPIWRAAWM